METIKCTDDNIKQIVKEQIELLGNEADLNHLDVSNVTSMGAGATFYFSQFNGDISKWDVSEVKDMGDMFGCSSFNGDISKWDVGNVTNMRHMFYKSQFNGDISKWDVGNVTDMLQMFSDSQFTGDVSNWDVSNVTDMSMITYMPSMMFDKCPIPEENKPKRIEVDNKPKDRAEKKMEKQEEHKKTGKMIGIAIVILIAFFLLYL